MTTPTSTGISATALPKATVRDVGRIAWLLSIAFAWDRDAELSARRAGTTPSAQRRFVLLAAASVPVNVVTALIFIANGELYHGSGAVLRLQSRTGARQRIPKMIAAVAAFIAVLVVVEVAALLLLPFVIVNGLLSALVAIAVVMVVSAIASVAVFARQHHRLGEYTKSKRSPHGAVNGPPHAPLWKATSLATDPRPRVRHRYRGAFQVAEATLATKVPTGDVVELAAASSDLVVAYRRAGFVQWHPTSLSMWKLY